ncbi:uridine-cytidine kinase-like protein-like 1 [Pseudovirgaria hyperparasitica]|uniref:Uridine kinase n=1 Tax=Pseudovirgaria hyperparasitica TaxID=470096 RepID=A0A6A6VYL0_9PEZI|nr:uridine-cytidine kinase-like protein-like 1 [Pseudovirgaria hyperparasitica]KAF2755305.1 uridine-cytidine kinase-like protein-like 1 [Pseudovirgaria hyperparasitica]
MPSEKYSPPWENTSIIGVAGSSGSGKTSLALAIREALNLPWVIIISMDSFYKPLTKDQSVLAFKNEYDFDSPEAIDFDILVEKLQDLKTGKKAEMPIYSFAKHNREPETNTIYSPSVLILEGIFALHDQRVLDMLDMKVFAEADADLCLSRRLVRDVKERGRDIEGCIKQWFKWVKPNFYKYVQPQREIADLIVPRGIENTVAIGMMTDRINKILLQKSREHQVELRRLGVVAQLTPLSPNVIVLPDTNQIRAINTLLLDPNTDAEDYIFYFDRLSSILIERAVSLQPYDPITILTPQGNKYSGLTTSGHGSVSAVAILRGGSILEPGLRRILPECKTGRLLIQTNPRTGEPELHYLQLAPDVEKHSLVMLLDPQMSSGGAALMAVRVLVDHGVSEDRIVFVTYMAGRTGLQRMMSVFPNLRVVLCRVVDDMEVRWVEKRYLGC